MRPVRIGLRRLALAAAWLAIVVAIAFGGAGIAAGIDHPPGPARPELTWAVDRAVRPRLDAATDELRRLAADVDALGGLARAVLATVGGRDEGALRTQLDDGEALLAGIESRTAALRASLDAMPGFGPGEELRIGATERARRAALAGAVDATAGLGEAWTLLDQNAGAAARIASLLGQHAETAFAATTAARSLDYAGAVDTVEAAQAILDEIATLRNALRAEADTSALDDALARYGAYDRALHRLYVAFRDGKGRVTDDARAAIEDERAARARLPKDDGAVRIVLAEIGQQAATRAVLAIEDARGVLSSAVEDAAPEASPVGPGGTLTP